MLTIAQLIRSTLCRAKEGSPSALSQPFPCHPWSPPHIPLCTEVICAHAVPLNHRQQDQCALSVHRAQHGARQHMGTERRCQQRGPQIPLSPCKTLGENQT